MTPPANKRVAPEGNPDWEIAMTTNCVGAVLLTDLLLAELKRTAANKVSSCQLNKGQTTLSLRW